MYAVSPHTLCFPEINAGMWLPYYKKKNVNFGTRMLQTVCEHVVIVSVIKKFAEFSMKVCRRLYVDSTGVWISMFMHMCEGFNMHMCIHEAVAGSGL